MSSQAARTPPSSELRLPPLARGGFLGGGLLLLFALGGFAWDYSLSTEIVFPGRYVALGQAGRAVERAVDHAEGRRQAGEHEEALAALDRAVAPAPDLQELFGLALADVVKLGRTTEAMGVVDARVDERLARADRDGAIRVLRGAFRLMPGDPRVRRRLAELHLARAETKLEGGAFDDLSTRQLRDGEPEAAIATLERRLRLRPALAPRERLARAQRLARALVAAGRTAEAIDVLLTLAGALEREAGAPNGTDRLARALEQLLALDPARDEASERLAGIYARRRQTTGARRHDKRLWHREQRAGDVGLLVRTLHERAPDRPAPRVEQGGRVLAIVERLPGFGG